MAMYSEFSHEKWWFSIAMSNYQRVTWFKAIKGDDFPQSHPHSGVREDREVVMIIPFSSSVIPFRSHGSRASALRRRSPSGAWRSRAAWGRRWSRAAAAPARPWRPGKRRHDVGRGTNGSTPRQKRGKWWGNKEKHGKMMENGWLFIGFDGICPEKWLI